MRFASPQAPPPSYTMTSPLPLSSFAIAGAGKSERAAANPPSAAADLRRVRLLILVAISILPRECAIATFIASDPCSASSLRLCPRLHFAKSWVRLQEFCKVGADGQQRTRDRTRRLR